MIGFSLAANGNQGLKHFKKKDGEIEIFFLFPKKGVQWDSVGFIVLSWVISPLMSGCLAFSLFLFVRTAILRRENSLTLAYIFTPFFYFVVTSIIVLSILYEGSSSEYFKTLPTWAGLVATFCFGFVVALFSIIVILPVMRRYNTRDREAFERFPYKYKLKYLFCFGPYREIPSDLQKLEFPK